MTLSKGEKQSAKRKGKDSGGWEGFAKEGDRAHSSCQSNSFARGQRLAASLLLAEER